MVLKELKYQVPVLYNFYDVINTVKELGDFISDIDPKVYSVNGNDFTYLRDMKLYRLYDKYSVILSTNENNIESCAVSKKSIDEVISALNSKLLDTDNFLEFSKDTLQEIRLDTIKHILKLYKNTKDMLDSETNKVINDIDSEISFQDILDSIDDQFKNTTIGIVDCIYSNGVKYTLHNPCNGIYAICRSEKSKEIRFIEKTKFFYLLNNLKESIIENYWNMIGDPLYVEIMYSANIIFMLSNRMENLEILLNYNNCSLKGGKASLKEKHKIKKLLKKSKIIS